jgi:hypothetical protein
MAQWHFLYNFVSYTLKMSKCSFLNISGSPKSLSELPSGN